MTASEGSRCRALVAALRAILAGLPRLFDDRADSGRIVDGHGDLRPEHICLLPQPVIIDCLEFDRELRLLDTASELAFLTLECQRLGAPDLDGLLRNLYSELSGDRPAPVLWAFYAGLHACVRAMLSLGHLDYPDGTRREKHRAKGIAYLQLAERVTRDLPLG
jgi:aminoglycoside phosphotransferase family enzyme